MSLGAAVRKMVEMGLTGEQIAELCDAFEEGREPEQTPRQARNRRYYERRRERLNSDGSDVLKRLNKTPPLKDDSSPTDLDLFQDQNPTPTPVSPLPRSQTRNERFEMFWRAYPRKVGKGASRTAFERAERKINGGRDPFETIMAGLAAAKASLVWRHEPQFIPHPATWLNQERWEDESPDRGLSLAERAVARIAAREAKDAN